MSTKYSVIAKKPVEENIKLQGSLGKKFPCLMLHVRSLPFYFFYWGWGGGGAGGQKSKSPSLPSKAKTRNASQYYLTVKWSS